MCMTCSVGLFALLQWPRSMPAISLWCVCINKVYYTNTVSDFYIFKTQNTFLSENNAFSKPDLLIIKKKKNTQKPKATESLLQRAGIALWWEASTLLMLVAASWGPGGGCWVVWFAVALPFGDACNDLREQMWTLRSFNICQLEKGGAHSLVICCLMF